MNDNDSGWLYDDEDTRFNGVDESDFDALDPDDEDLYESGGAWERFCGESGDDEEDDDGNLHDEHE
jgi:hypothetical protein